MAAPRLEFEIPEDFDLLDGLKALNPDQEIAADADSEFSRTFLDTFDWRLFRKGFVLYADSVEGRMQLACQTLDTSELVHIQTCDRIPVFVEDLPDGKMHKAFAPILEMRALLPQARLNGRKQCWRLLNKQKKTVVRLKLERASVEDSGREPKKLRLRFYLEAVKGCVKDFTELGNLLRERLNFPPVTPNVLVSALDLLGRHAADYTSKLGLHLEPAMRADAAVRMVFSRLFSILESNEAGTKQPIDCEFLHDFRVAIRKTRTLLNQSKNILPKDLIEQFAQEFSWLGKSTGPSRDLDVCLLNFDGYKNAVPVSIRNDLEPLRDFIRNKQKDAQSELIKALESSRYAKLKKEWRKFLVQSPDRTLLKSQAEKPIREIADARIRNVYKAIRRKGRAIDFDTKPSKLHRLRIHCKKLRYLMDFFRSLYPAKPVRHLSKSLKALQDNLGRFQDLKVQSLILQRYTAEMMESRAAAARTLLAMGVLVRELQKERERVRCDFMQRFKEFDSPENRKRFQSLFKNEDAQKENVAL